MAKTPQSMKDLCLNFCVRHLKNTLLEDVYIDQERKYPMETDGYLADSEAPDENMDYQESVRSPSFQFRSGVFLPEQLSESLFQQTLSKYGVDFIEPFHDNMKCKLRRIDLSDTEIHNRALITKLFVHPLVEINLSGCIVDMETLLRIANCSNSLRNLWLSRTVIQKPKIALKLLSNLKYLQMLDLSHTQFQMNRSDVKTIAELRHLCWLDLSKSEVQDITPLTAVSKTLSWLSLYDCQNLSDTSSLISTFKEMTVLQHLDLSKGHFPSDNEYMNITESVFPDVTSQLLEVLSSLPSLERLDISGSVGLVGSDLMYFHPPRKRLKFLGLSRTGLCYHNKIPADVITGEANEIQIFASLEVYAHRLFYVWNSLRDLFNITSSHLCQNSSKAIELVLSAMKNHKTDAGVQIAGSASLYHLSRGDHPTNKDTRRSIVSAVLDAMEFHPSVLQLQKNCCLTLCNFHIPDEVEFQYIRMTDILLTALKGQKDNYLRRIAITLFNTIVCHNSGDQKLAVGRKGSIEIIVKIISEIIETTDTDHLLETCWSSLWNVTDETPDNCRNFITCGGMELFVKCLQQFPDKPEIQRNMMGLLGNVAEVTALRPLLLKLDYLEIFYKLLDTSVYELEVSYNAGGVLAHLASDGGDEWSPELTRDTCMERLMTSVESWNIKSSRNINYRSFEPILRLLEFFETPAVQRWATWALANLTQVYPDRYCKLLFEENGIQKLENIKLYCMDPFSVDLAIQTIDRVSVFLEHKKQP